MSSVIDKETQWKSIFETVQALSERKQENNKDAIKKAIKEKVMTIKRLYLNNLGIPKYLMTEKPLSLKKMEKGLQNYFFGRKGQLTNHFAFIRKEVYADERKKLVNLEKKIDTGPLTYYFLKENEDQYEKRVNEVKKHKLKISANYIVQDDKDFDLDKIKFIEQLASIYDSIGMHNSNIVKKNPSKKIMLDISKKRDLTPRNRETNKMKMSSCPKTPTKSRNTKIPLLYTDSTRQHNRTTKTLFSLSKHHQTKTDSRSTLTKSSYQPLSTSYKTFQTEPRVRNLRHSLGMTKTLLLTKASEWGNNQEQLEKRLFKLIDDSNIERKDFFNQAKDKDLEEILELKVKKKNRKGEAKEMFIQAIKLKDDYTQMDRDKAEMLKLSDEITRMSDEAALLFADRITDAYYKKSDRIEDNEYKLNPFIEKQKKLKVFKLRNKMNLGLIKMKKLSFNLDFEKSNLKSKYPK